MPAERVEARASDVRHRLLLALGATALAALLLLAPTGRLGQIPLASLAHVPLFAVLVVVWMRALAALGLHGWRAVGLCVGAGVVFAAGSELAQAWIPGRWPGVGDLMRNLLGLAIGLALCPVLARPPSRRGRRPDGPTG